MHFPFQSILHSRLQAPSQFKNVIAKNMERIEFTLRWGAIPALRTKQISSVTVTLKIAVFVTSKQLLDRKHNS